ncbi:MULTISPECIES: DUF5681 domain-containing protein [Roseovarius]|uniref:DUF5681 domain-containing protein n=1 Tax=Roseovarius TaxID=74030 RepID=UPI00273E3B6B|nr:MULTISPECIES: DUF5681 domain-containing protein [unclassified Roseovarius]
MTRKNDRNSGANTEGRKPDGTFAPGNPGKPKGSRHRATQAVQELLDADGEALTRKAVELALEGDTTALRLCMERIAPARKDTPVNFDLPAMKSAKDASQAAQAVLQAVSKGQLTPLEGASVMALVEGYRKALETTELEQRITALEAAK